MADEQQHKPFTFSGRGGEYFRIWIVNLCLSLVTLGIYSAWAKVRRLQYFYRHTSVADAGLDFHGNPVAILKGRILAVILFGGYSLTSHLNPAASLAMFALIMAVMPWLLVRSLSFKLRNTSYRGLRFSFRGKTGDAYINFLLLPLASYISAGLLWPLAQQQMTHYVRSNSAYGNGRFGFHAKYGAFYKPYLVVFGAAILILIVAAGAGIMLSNGLHARMGSADTKTQYMILGFSIIGIFYLGLLLFAVPYLTSRLQNVIFNHTSLGTFGFSSHLRARDLFGIMLSNLLLIILTLGLYKPFADIRMARYRVERLALKADSDIDAFVAEQQADVSAAGEEIADVFDLDIAA